MAPIPSRNYTPISLDAAAEYFDLTPVAIRKRASRYNARKLATIHRRVRRVYYDLDDLAAIDGYIHRGEPVPPTPEERDRLRDARRAAA